MLNPSDLIGKEINGRYRIIERLGGGGTGEVYKAENVLLQSLVAVKLLKGSPDQVIDSSSSARLEQEARAAADLFHPNIISVTDIGFLPDSSPYIVMDYFEGKSLADVIANDGPLGIEQCIAVFIQIADGLVHAHEKGILHRDIKPSNIMVADLQTQPQARLIDFGGSQSMNLVSRSSSTDVVGSPFYMSPEQCQGLKLDQRSDVFSLGCTIFEVLTGKPPFLGDNVMSTIYKRTIENAPTLSETGGGPYPGELESLVKRCLQRKPEQRYASVQQIRTELASLKYSARAGSSLNNFPSRLADFFQKHRAMSIAIPLLVGMLGLVVLLSRIPACETSPCAKQHTPGEVRNNHHN
jgi:serine/threonine protein kinase